MKQTKNKHKAKVKLARKMIGGRVGIKMGGIHINAQVFGSKAWRERAKRIRERVAKRDAKSHEKALKRKEEKAKSKLT